MATDGAVRGDSWRDKTPREYPDWLQVAFSAPVTVARVEVYTNTIAEYEIQLERNGQLVEVAEGKRPEEGPIVARFTPAEASAVRVVAKSGTGDLTEITEIEVYGP
jgi:hypothetical protein